MCLVSGNRQEAEEISQDAFLRVWERCDRVSTLEDPVGFLFRTAMNVFRDRARRASLAARKTLRLAERTDDLAAVEDRNELVRAMRLLTSHQRAALVLTGYLGYTSEEAAEILGVRGPRSERSRPREERQLSRSPVHLRDHVPGERRLHHSSRSLWDPLHDAVGPPPAGSDEQMRQAGDGGLELSERTPSRSRIPCSRPPSVGGCAHVETCKGCALPSRIDVELAATLERPQKGP